MEMLVSQMGKRGTLVIPAVLRKRFGLHDGASVAAEAREDGVLIRPVSVSPVEMYTPRRKAEFLLNNAMDAADYRAAVKEVKSMGLDPATIPHEAPRRGR
jgi:bifunctional DNA-binding transcriptional regulator/antitoxin component of YhaV-PrlF toxin-antitoxin module